MEVETRFVQFMYTNHRGETRRRRVIPRSIEYTGTDWYPRAQWILWAMDIDKAAQRGFALTQISEWQNLTLG